jgi:hypothetical protein
MVNSEIFMNHEIAQIAHFPPGKLRVHSNEFFRQV